MESAWGHFPWLYEDAMRRGYKIGVSANSDEHRGRCGGGVPGTAVFGTKGGLTGIIANELTRLAQATIRIEATIDGYVKVGNPLDGNPFAHCPAITWEVSGRELLENEAGSLQRQLGGAQMFIALERLSDEPVPREVSGTIEVSANNGPHGFRPVYFIGSQRDGAKAWTSAMFISFK